MTTNTQALNGAKAVPQIATLATVSPPGTGVNWRLHCFSLGFYLQVMQTCLKQCAEEAPPHLHLAFWGTLETLERSAAALKITSADWPLRPLRHGPLPLSYASTFCESLLEKLRRTIVDASQEHGMVCWYRLGEALGNYCDAVLSLFDRALRDEHLPRPIALRQALYAMPSSELQRSPTAHLLRHHTSRSVLEWLEQANLRRFAGAGLIPASEAFDGLIATQEAICAELAVSEDDAGSGESQQNGDAKKDVGATSGYLGIAFAEPCVVRRHGFETKVELKRAEFNVLKAVAERGASGIGNQELRNCWSSLATARNPAPGTVDGMFAAINKKIANVSLRVVARSGFRVLCELRP